MVRMEALQERAVVREMKLGSRASMQTKKRSDVHA